MATPTFSKWSGWFERVRDEFSELLQPYAGDNVAYVEVGVYAGASASWVLQNILTHEGSVGIGIDCWQPTPYGDEHELAEKRDDLERAKRRASRALRHPRFLLLEGSSDYHLVGLAELIGRRIDILYLDGRHEAPLVLRDFVLAFPQMNVGGLVILDDYRNRRDKPFPHVAEAAAAIQLSHTGLVKLVHVGRQVAFKVVRKKPDEAWLRTRADRVSSYKILGTMS